MEKLTTTQEKAFNFIEQSLRREGVAPTLRELCQYMGYSAVGSAQDIVGALRRKGYIRDLGRRTARSLVPVGYGEGHLNKGVEEIQAEFPEFASVASKTRVYDIPMLGLVPAGLPLDVAENKLGTIPFSVALLPRPTPNKKDLFAVKATGESMQGAGILDGDWLIVKREQVPKSGAIVVARVEGAVTVKRLINDSSSGWCLKPENPKFAIHFGHQAPFEIVGHVIALHRTISSKQ